MRRYERMDLKKMFVRLFSVTPATSDLFTAAPEMMLTITCKASTHSMCSVSDNMTNYEENVAVSFNAVLLNCMFDVL